MVAVCRIVDAQSQRAPPWQTLRWGGVGGVTFGGAGLVALKSDLASVTISVNAIRADPQEIYGEVDRRLRAHGYPGP